jgi:hypothetical protein
MSLRARREAPRLGRFLTRENVASAGAAAARLGFYSEPNMTKLPPSSLLPSTSRFTSLTLALGLSVVTACSTVAQEPPTDPPASGTGGSRAGGRGGSNGGGTGGTTTSGSGGSTTASGGSGGSASGSGGSSGGAGGAAVDAAEETEGGSDAPGSSPGTPGPTDLTKYKYSKPVKLNTTATGANVAGMVDNFPVPVVLDATSFDFTQAKDHGEDLRFANADGTLLPYAIESWDKAGKAAAVWVKVAHVMGNNDAQSFLMYWGNADAADAGDSKAVFDSASGFVGVWHLAEDGNNDPDGYKDASANEAHATGVSMEPGSRVPGRIGPATRLANSKEAPKDQWIKVDSAKRASLNTGPKPITVSIWALAKSFPNRSTIGGYETVISKGDTSWTLQRQGTGSKWETCVHTPAYHSCAISKTTNAVDKWFHFAIVFANPTITLYINGAKDATATDQGWEMGDHPLGIGQQTQSLMGKRNWDGILDEARVANVGRSADYIKLDFESQKEGAKLVSFGPVQTH